MANNQFIEQELAAAGKVTAAQVIPNPFPWGQAFILALTAASYIIDRVTKPKPQFVANRLPVDGTVKQRLVYGREQLDGDIVFLHEESYDVQQSTAVRGAAQLHTQRVLHLAIVLGRGPMDFIEGLLVDGVPVVLTHDHSDRHGSGQGALYTTVNDERYSGWTNLDYAGATRADRQRRTKIGAIQIREYFEADGTQGAALQGIGGWTADHRLDGWSWVYVKLYDWLEPTPTSQDATPMWSTVPRLSFEVWGRKLYWPGMPVANSGNYIARWTDNMAACLFDYRRLLYGDSNITENVERNFLTPAEFAAISADIDTSSFATSFAAAENKLSEENIMRVEATLTGAPDTSLGASRVIKQLTANLPTRTRPPNDNIVFAPDMYIEDVEIFAIPTTSGIGARRPHVKITAKRISTGSEDSRIPISDWMRNHRAVFRIEKVPANQGEDPVYLELTANWLYEDGEQETRTDTEATIKLIAAVTDDFPGVEGTGINSLLSLPENTSVTLSFYPKSEAYPIALVTSFEDDERNLLDDIAFAWQGGVTWHNDKFYYEAGRNITTNEINALDTLSRDEIVGVGAATVSPDVNDRINSISMTVQRLQAKLWQEHTLHIKDQAIIDNEDNGVELPRRLPDLVSMTYLHSAVRAAYVGLKHLRLFKGRTITLAPGTNLERLRLRPGQYIKVPDLEWTPELGTPDPAPIVVRIVRARINQDFSIDIFIRNEPPGLFTGAPVVPEVEPDVPAVSDIAAPALMIGSITSSASEVSLTPGSPRPFSSIRLTLQKLVRNAADTADVPEGDPITNDLSTNDFPFLYDALDPQVKYQLTGVWLDASQGVASNSLAYSSTFTTLAADPPPAMAASTFLLTEGKEELVANWASPPANFISDWAGTLLIWGTPATTAPPVPFAELGRMLVPAPNTRYVIENLTAGTELEVQAAYQNIAVPPVVGTAASKRGTPEALDAPPPAPTGANFPVPADDDVTQTSIRGSIVWPSITGIYAQVMYGEAAPVEGGGFAGTPTTIDNIRSSSFNITNQLPGRIIRVEMRFGLPNTDLSAAFVRNITTDAVPLITVEPARPTADDITMITHNSAQITYTPSDTYRTRIQVGIAATPFVPIEELTYIGPISTAATATHITHPLFSRTQYEVRVAYIDQYGRPGPYAGQGSA